MRTEEKHEFLLKEITCRWSEEGDYVLDGFIGTGTIAVAAINSYRYFYGCDVDNEVLERAVERVNTAATRLLQTSKFI